MSLLTYAAKLIFLFVKFSFIVDAHMGEGSFWTCLQDTQEENEVSMSVLIRTILV